jgi:hypothetical protein
MGSSLGAHGPVLVPRWWHRRRVVNVSRVGWPGRRIPDRSGYTCAGFDQTCRPNRRACYRDGLPPQPPWCRRANVHRHMTKPGSCPQNRVTNLWITSEQCVQGSGRPNAHTNLREIAHKQGNAPPLSGQAVRPGRIHPWCSVAQRSLQRISCSPCQRNADNGMGVSRLKLQPTTDSRKIGVLSQSTSTNRQTPAVLADRSEPNLKEDAP